MRGGQQLLERSTCDGPFEHRHYDPNVGLFLTPDPVEDDQENTYRYVGNSPTNSSDPSGLQSKDVLQTQLDEIDEKILDVVNQWNQSNDQRTASFVPGVSLNQQPPNYAAAVRNLGRLEGELRELDLERERLESLMAVALPADPNAASKAVRFKIAKAITSDVWDSTLEAWYHETGDNPLVVKGVDEPRNKAISEHPGFRMLLNSWIVSKKFELDVPANSRAAGWDGDFWEIRDDGFTWNFTNPLNPAPVPGGVASFNETGLFLGSYDVTIDSAVKQDDGTFIVTVTVENQTGWESATRYSQSGIDRRKKADEILDRTGVDFKFTGETGGSDFPDHQRGAYYDSKGGDLQQFYKFEVEVLPVPNALPVNKE